MLTCLPAVGFGIIGTPTFGIAEALGGADSVEYNNALGFFVLSKSLPTTNVCGAFAD